MPKATKSGLEKPVDISIRVVRNGVSVTGCKEGKDSLEYVYSSLEKALREVPGIVSVLGQDDKEVTKSELDKEEERINSSQEREE
jgi:hypothetical protein